MKNAMRHSSSVETLRKPDGQAALQIQGTRKMKERNGQKNRGPEKQGARKTEGQKNRGPEKQRARKTGLPPNAGMARIRCLKNIGVNLFKSVRAERSGPQAKRNGGVKPPS
jgi:hypothetical protein